VRLGKADVDPCANGPGCGKLIFRDLTIELSLIVGFHKLYLGTVGPSKMNHLSKLNHPGRYHLYVNPIVIAINNNSFTNE